MQKIEETPRFSIQYRQEYEVNNDPQRRCYNGAHFSTEKVWGPWQALAWPLSQEEGEAKIKRFQEWDTEMSALNKKQIVREYKLSPPGMN